MEQDLLSNTLDEEQTGWVEIKKQDTLKYAFSLS